MTKLATNLEKLRDLPDEELRQALATTRDDLFRLHLGTYTNQVTSTAEVRSKRRDIARILTILKARELGFEAQAEKKPDEAPAAEEAPKKKTRKAKAKS
jgi:large subunit ribosomal protein L29